MEKEGVRRSWRRKKTRSWRRKEKRRWRKEKKGKRRWTWGVEE